MGFFAFVMMALCILAVVLAAKGITIIQQAETMVIERLGRYHRTLDSGLHVIWPFFDRPKTIEWRYAQTDIDGSTIIRKRTVKRIDLRETVYDFPRQNVITKDNVLTEINAMIYFQVTDPMKSVYEIANLPDAIEKLTQTSLRNIIGEMELDHTLTSRDTINGKLRTILDEATHKWGVKVNRVELQDIIPPQDIRDAMEKQMRAERNRRAVILEAEGQKQSQILQAEGVRMSQIQRAEGERQAKALVAEGEAQARVKIAEAEATAVKLVTQAISASQADPASYLIAVRYIDALKEMVSGKDNKVVYLPYEATGVLGSLGGIRDLFTSSKPAGRQG